MERAVGLTVKHYTDCILKSPQTYPCYLRMISMVQIHRMRAITEQDLQLQPLNRLKSPFRELLLASMHMVAPSHAAAAEAQAVLNLAESRNDPELCALLEYLLA